MNPTIQNYFENNYTLELQEVLNKTISLFTRLNLFSYETYILNTLAEITNENSDFIGSNFIAYFEGLVVGLEKGFGFRLSEDLTLEQRTDFVRAYVDLEDYIDHEAVVRVLETDMNASEKLAEVVALTGAPHKDILISFICDVDESALETLEQLHLSSAKQEDLENETDAPSAPPEHVKQVKAYILYLSTFPLVFKNAQLVRDGYEIGLPFSVYWDKVKGEVTQLDSASFAIEFVGLCLLSKDHWANPYLAYPAIAEEIFDSLNIITSVNIFVQNLIAGFTKFKTENRI